MTTDVRRPGLASATRWSLRAVLTASTAWARTGSTSPRSSTRARPHRTTRAAIPRGTRYRAIPTTRRADSEISKGATPLPARCRRRRHTSSRCRAGGRARISRGGMRSWTACMTRSPTESRFNTTSIRMRCISSTRSSISDSAGRPCRTRWARQPASRAATARPTRSRSGSRPTTHTSRA